MECQRLLLDEIRVVVRCRINERLQISSEIGGLFSEADRVYELVFGTRIV
jgi:hypothetical protein